MKYADLRKKAAEPYRRCPESSVLIFECLKVKYRWVNGNMRQNWRWLDHKLANDPKFAEGIRKVSPGNQAVLEFHREGAIYFCAKDNGMDAAMLLKLSRD